MKTSIILTGLALCGLITLLAACKKQEEPTAPQQPKSSATTPGGATKQVAREVERVVEQTGAAVQQVTKEAAKEAEKATQQAKDQVTAAQQQAQTSLNQVAAEVQKLIDQAKALMGSQQYQDAMAIVQKLGDMSLTPEQKKVVGDLKAQLEKLLASDAAKQGTKALEGVLGGKK